MIGRTMIREITILIIRHKTKTIRLLTLLLKR